MDSYPSVSVIIPVFNGEKHLRRCIDSVFACGFEGLEVLLLDDGSSDGSAGILEDYEKEHPGIVRVFTHKNMGVALTRNKGIGLARGKYILFLDQDDWFDKDYIHTFCQAIESSGADVVVGGYKRPDADGRIVLRRLLPGTGHYRYITAAAWGKIHRTSYLIENDIEFFDNKIGEDVAFSMKEATLPGRFSFLPYVGYNWFLNKESVSETSYKGFRENVGLFRYLEKLGGFDYEDGRIEEYFVLKAAYYYLMHSGREGTPGKYKEAYAEVMGWIAGRYPAFLKNRFLNFGLPGETLKVRLAVCILTMIHRAGAIGLFARLYCKGRDDSGTGPAEADGTGPAEADGTGPAEADGTEPAAHE
ncbi:MAG: glycosyltransferase family 2 protein [Clostridiales bacterium]|nr:glycosyltransferase family 2 protein [Clostridiales bacterium]